MTIEAIDFGRLYINHMAVAKRAEKPASAWDARAARMKKKPTHSAYVKEFIARMDLSDSISLLDVGCGSGAIGLEVAGNLQRVVGLDYSRAMLDEMQAQAAVRSLNNVEALHLAWEDDWSDVPECDIVVASRSTTPIDIASALSKLHAKARKRVYLTHLVGGRFIDPDILSTIGRSQPAEPDYIYLLNILHRMGIHAKVDFISHESRLAETRDFEDFVQRVGWSAGELSPAQIYRLLGWYRDHLTDSGLVCAPMRWAFLSWDKAPCDFPATSEQVF